MTVYDTDGKLLLETTPDTRIGLDFDEQHLPKANFSKMELDGVNFSDCCLRDANFDDAELYWASFYRADCTNASLKRADLRGANLDEANFTNADLKGANLGRDNLNGETSIEGTRFTGALYNSETKFSDDFNPEEMEMIYVRDAGVISQ